MECLSFYLDKYKKLVPPDDAVRSEFVRAVEQIVGVVINKGDVSFRDGTIYVKASPALKSELYLHQGDIMSSLESSLSERAPRAIR